ncbi:hypothetical protein DAEQUDRAFT_733719 [Daedalea quercina L-15889]|uniref:SAP domain-containing protein n=1 Tax=Daedalea quercina L-15889 TaxID=1314783 RepID=A0A165KSI2_9APHY|nr:hypothetical protein DAEQUDRAFT_733719 [Daedalea quercina L-15889]
MAATTQILYNSPALHSLKREQLVKLCKTHSLKANGKNTELIERLKKHAFELGQETFLDSKNAEHQKENIHDVLKGQIPRPSEQWEVVMEDIQEVPEPIGTMSSKGTFTSTRGGAEEFGSKTSTVSSSIRALATSLGIKRTSDKANASLNKHAVPFEDLPPPDALPRTEPAPLSTPDVEALKEAARAAADDGDGDVSMSAPVPGSPSRPGAPAPANARLSMGQGPTTTIRLINPTSPTAFEAPGTPVLPTFQTNFDLVLGSLNPTTTPGQVVSVWPASPSSPPSRLYPSIPFEDLLAAKASSVAPGDDLDMPGGLGESEAPTTQGTPAKKSGQPLLKGTPKPVDTPDIFSPMRPAAARATATANTDANKLGIPRSEPFLFGSPLPRNSLSNQQFSETAQSLMQEMRRRLAEQNKDNASEQKLSGGSVPPIFGLIDKGQAVGKQGSPDRFEKAHEVQFNKMDSIANHYAAKRPVAPGASAGRPASKKRKSDALGLGHAPGIKRKSSAAGTRVISNGARKRMAVPGGFGADDDDDEEDEDPGDRRSSKRVRVSEVDGVHHGKRVSIAPPASVIQACADAGEQEAKKQKEREAIRRKLDANKARRRSSRGRVSVGGKTAIPKAKSSRFGFLSSAKTLVKNVWNMGGGSAATSKPTPAASSSIPVAKPTQAATAAKATTTITAQPTVQNPSMRSTTSTARKSSISTSNKLQKPRPESQAASSRGIGSVKSSRSSTAQTRAPIPSFASPPSGTASSRMSTSTVASKIPSRPGSIAGASSLGVRTSLATKSQGPASSIGTRRSIATTSNSTSTKTSTSDPSLGPRERDSRSRTSSLLAPTASSLARMVAKPESGTAGRQTALPSVAEQPVNRPAKKSVASATKAALNAVTNSPRSPRSPRPTKIFAQPLTADTFSSPVSQSSPVHHTSLGAAATVLSSPSRIPTAVPPRPKGLIAKKPRISRTRVIAKIGAQRESTQPAGPSALAPAPRVRSSVGARKSLGGVKTGHASAGGEAAKLAAKKRARQSEYARRRSRASGRASMIDEDVMDVDV